MIQRILPALAFVAFAPVITSAQTCSGTGCLVISQVYGGGGNSGSNYKNDFIEIFNQGSSGVSLSGLSVQYAAATGISWQVTALTSVTLAAGHYYLIQENAQGGGTTNLPTADATGSGTGIAMSANQGQVALVSTITALTGACPSTGATVIDIMSYGTSACSPAAPALLATTSDSRNMAGCFAGVKPSASNGTTSGFTAGAVNPRNSLTAANLCGTTTTLSFTPATLPAGAVSAFYSQTFAASGGTGGGYTYSSTGTLPPGLSLSGATLSGTPTTTTGSPFAFQITVMDSSSNMAMQSYSVTINGTFTCAPTKSIAEIQGSGQTSPSVGTTITTIGIVTAIRSNGFYMQMPSPGDGDPLTSDAVFVFTQSAPGTNAAIGNSVCVTGGVQEFAPDIGYGTITEISGPTVTPLSTGNALPAPVTLTAADFNPSGGIYQREKYEGMRVAVASITVVAPSEGTLDEPNATATSNGVFFGVLPGTARPFREAGIDAYDTLPAGAPATVPVWDDNPEILRVNTAQLTGGVALDVTSGATVSNLVGVFDYKYGQYTLLTDPTSPPIATGNVTYTATPVALSTDLTVASFNLQHFYDTNDDPNSDVVLTAQAFSNRLAKASLAIRNVINTPDILALEEVENLSTAQALAARIDTDAGVNAPHYTAYLSAGNDSSDINNAFLVKTSKVNVVSVTQYGKTTTYTDPTSGSQALLNDRPPLVLKATAQAARSNQTLAVTVIANHLRSLLDVNDSASGARVRAKREAGAEFLANLIQTFQAAGDKVIAVGDFNAYQVNDGYVDVLGVVRGNPAPTSQDVVPAASGLVNPVLTDALSNIATAQQYSDTFDGTAQAIDHFLYSQNIASSIRQVVYGRVNADFPEAYRSDATRPERVSDHDPVVGYITLPPSVSAIDVTSQTTVTGSGLLYNRVTQVFSGTMTIMNNGAQAIAGPIELVLTNLSSGVTMQNAAGANGGSPYISTPLSIPAGGSVTLTVQFKNTTNVPVSYTPKVYSGSF